ncbi:hypothetical protein K488DRAFT_84762, partial [Vararia minispora EC-137]
DDDDDDDGDDDSSGSEADDDDDAGTATHILAHILDVPLDVLPGRQREFSAFVSKVLFGAHGALAGVTGTAAVVLRVEGLVVGPGGGDGDGEGEGELVLAGLPFSGSVRVNKRM